MARRKLTAPSSEALSRLEAEFRSETPSSAVAPIAQVASEAALAAPVVDTGTRVDAEAYRTAQAEDRVIVEIPLSEIMADDMVRDRADLSPEAMEELKGSIARNGLRLPIELYAREGPGPAYGILSGFRRFKAYEGLYGLTGDARYGRIRALIRRPASVPEAFAAMVEENEIRENLSHFERGRIVSIAAQNGVFETMEAAVDALFAQASKAKRSKIRTFAQIFEALGDVLTFPAALTERQGLRLAAALRAGGTGDLRKALARKTPANLEEEWAQVELIMVRFEASGRQSTRGGRPVTQRALLHRHQTATGLCVEYSADAKAHVIRVSGAQIDPKRVQAGLEALIEVLEQE